MPKSSPFPGFPPQGRRFLRALGKNNNREWFLEHKPEYEEHVRQPMTALVLALGQELERLAPEMWTDPAKAIYRIYRDVRFSADKSPYKTHVAAIFGLRSKPKHTSASLYFHIEPEKVIIAAGAYQPPPPQLLALRKHIARNHAEMRKILAGREFRRVFSALWGDQLTRVPKGFAADDPAADLLRYKQWVVEATHPGSLADTAQLYGTLAEAFRALMPLVRFLNRGVES